MSEAWMSTSMPVNRVQGLASRTDKKMSAFLFLLFFFNRDRLLSEVLGVYCALRAGILSRNVDGAISKMFPALTK